MFSSSVHRCVDRGFCLKLNEKARNLNWIRTVWVVWVVELYANATNWRHMALVSAAHIRRQGFWYMECRQKFNWIAASCARTFQFDSIWTRIIQSQSRAAISPGHRIYIYFLFVFHLIWLSLLSKPISYFSCVSSVPRPSTVRTLRVACEWANRIITLCA